MANVVDNLRVGINDTRVGVVQFANQGENLFYMNTYTTAEEVREAILTIRYSGGNTNTSGGLRVMREQQYIESRGERRSK